MAKKYFQDIDKPVTSATSNKESCDGCKFYKPIDVLYGYCHRQLLSVIDPGKLTPHGPRGVYAVMTTNDYCGNYQAK